MTFIQNNLSILAHANGFTLWHYRAGDDALAGLDRAGFFAKAADILSPGDILMASGADGARIGVIARRDHALMFSPF